MAPALKSVERSGRNLTLAFDQRLGGDSAAAFKAAIHGLSWPRWMGIC